MLHLALSGTYTALVMRLSNINRDARLTPVNLSGNILCSIGETPKLYRKLSQWNHNTYVPEYPEEMLYQDITLNLDNANKRNIRTFMEASIQVKTFSQENSECAFSLKGRNPG
jgi:hypothetical protein